MNYLRQIFETIDRLKVYVREGSRDHWWLMTLCILFVSLAARLILINADTLEFDSYRLMADVDKSFVEYLKIAAAYPLPMRVHYWISYRLFGGELSDYLILPVVASLATVLVIYFGLNRYWSSAKGIAFFTLCLYAFNSHTIYLASYGMFPYAFSLLVATVLYFTFLNFSLNLQARIRWYWIPIAIIPAAFFTNLITVIPVLAGVISVVLYRWYRIPEARNVKNLLQQLNSLWPLLIFPIAYILIYTLQPFTNIGLEKRPDMAEYFFYSSSNAQYWWGRGQFLWSGTTNLLGQILSPSRPVGLSGLQIPSHLRATLAMLTLGLLLCGWVCTRMKFWKAKKKLVRPALFTESPQLVFTLLYIGVMYSGIAVGGLLGLYPFGEIRYASYLLVPVLIALGYFFSWGAAIISINFAVSAGWRRVFMGLASVFIVLGIIATASNYYGYLQRRAELSSVFESIRHTDVELVLIGSYPEPALSHFTPSIYDDKKFMNIGWGTFWGHGNDGGAQALLNLITEADKSKRTVKSILVIASTRQQFDEQYPSYSKTVEKYYQLKQETTAINIWTGKYIKK